jgi:hypothetical protein
MGNSISIFITKNIRTPFIFWHNIIIRGRLTYNGKKQAVYYIVNGAVFFRMQLTLSINSSVKVSTILCVVAVNGIFFPITPFFSCLESSSH